MHDLRFAVRMLQRNPVWTLLVVAPLALVVGANTALFALVDSVLLRPFPYHEPDRVVLLWTTVDDTDRRGISGQDLDRWASRRDLFDGLVPFLANSRRDAVPGIPAAVVEARALSLLGTPPSVGRLPVPADGEPGATPVAVISHGLWTSQFAGRRDAIGKRVRAEGDEYEVIGVMPRGFFFPDQDVQIWCVFHPRETRGYETAGVPLFHSVARLAPGVSAESAARSLGELQRRDRGHWRPVVLPIQRLTIDRYQTALLTLQAALGSLLLIVCVSVGTLVAARADSRRPELHTRVFLGATFGRLLRQLLSEGAVIAVLVAILAVPVAEVGLHGLLWLDSSGVFRVSGAGLGLPALAFLFGIAILALVITVRVGVRPDGTVAETALVQGLPLLSDVAIGAASRASFECRKCTEPSTPHLIAFVFSFRRLRQRRQAAATCVERDGRRTLGSERVRRRLHLRSRPWQRSTEQAGSRPSRTVLVALAL